MSCRRVVSAVLVPATLLLFTGCTTTVWIGPEQIQPEHKFKRVVTADGQEVKLDPAAAYLKGDTIYSSYYGATSDIRRFPLDDVEQVGIEGTDVGGKVALTLGIALGAVAVAFGVAILVMALSYEGD